MLIIQLWWMQFQQEQKLLDDLCGPFGRPMP